MSTIPTHTYSNPNFSGSNQAVNSPQINLPYIWDNSLNGAQGAWRPTTTGDFLTATIENAQVNVNIEKDEDSVNIYTTEGQSINANLQINNSNVTGSNPVPVSQINTPASYSSNIFNNGTTAVRTMSSNGVTYTKHSYSVTFQGDTASDSARIKFQVSNDNTFWNTIEERVANFDLSTDAELAYYDEHNFLYTKVVVELIQGDSSCYIREAHSA